MHTLAKLLSDATGKQNGMRKKKMVPGHMILRLYESDAERIRNTRNGQSAESEIRDVSGARRFM